jgi:OOP family OmpA-OmpF porin
MIKLRLLPGLLAASLLALPASAQEGIRQGLYGALSGGVSFNSHVDYSGSSALLNANGSIKLSPGFGVLGAVGYQWRNGFAVEAEAGYRRMGADTLGGTFNVPSLGVTVVAANVPIGGNVDALSFMANGRYGIEIDGGLTPFILAGAGVARTGANNISVTGITILDDTDWVFAYQAGAGVNVALGGPFSAEVAYRFFGTSKPKFSAADGTPVKTNFKNHSVFLTLKYAFGPEH